jgi:enamine deaminase RidA (YjgF/YER057c/UK114 family)
MHEISRRETTARMSKIVSHNNAIYLRDMKDFTAMNRVWDNWVPEGFAPARACVEARMARPDLLVEISVIAAKRVG